MAQLLSVNVGLPRDIEWRGRIVHTGIWKEPVQGRRRVGRLNVEGDGQGDPGGHGGEQRALSTASSERTSLLGGCLISRSASATATESEPLCSRCPSPASPVTASGFEWTRRECLPS